MLCVLLFTRLDENCDHTTEKDRELKHVRPYYRLHSSLETSPITSYFVYWAKLLGDIRSLLPLYNRTHLDKIPIYRPILICWTCSGYSAQGCQPITWKLLIGVRVLPKCPSIQSTTPLVLKVLTSLSETFHLLITGRKNVKILNFK